MTGLGLSKAEQIKLYKQAMRELIKEQQQEELEIEETLMKHYIDKVNNLKVENVCNNIYDNDWPEYSLNWHYEYLSERFQTEIDQLNDQLNALLEPARKFIKEHRACPIELNKPVLKNKALKLKYKDVE